MQCSEKQCENRALFKCSHCKKGFCSEHAISENGDTYCPDCGHKLEFMDRPYVEPYR